MKHTCNETIQVSPESIAGYIFMRSPVSHFKFNVFAVDFEGDLLFCLANNLDFEKASSWVDALNREYYPEVLTETELVEILATSILFSPLFFYESSLEIITDYQKEDSFEVFYLDSSQLKCLYTEDNDYKSYALNPKQFLKTFRVNDINSFVFKQKHSLIVTSKFIIRPKELNAQNIGKIKSFVEKNFPDKLNLESEHHKALKNESEMYFSKLLLVLPLILAFIVIYFFGDNGRNHLVTYSSIAVILLFYIFLIIKIKRKK